MSSKKVVVLGGGYAGLWVTSILDSKFDVTLVDRKTHFWHSIGAPRAMVDPEFRHKMMIPLEKTVKRGKFLQGNVESVSKDRVVVDGTEIAFDYLVVATGTQVNSPGKVPENEKDVAVWADDTFATYADVLKRAKTVVCVGGGPTGIEIAAEIRTEFPDKQVTIVHSGDSLASTQVGAPTKFVKGLEEKVKKLGIKVITNNRVVEPAAPNNYGFVESSNVVLKDGTQFDADLVLFTVGHVKYNTGIMEENFSDFMTKRGTLKVNDHLQLPGHDNIFVGGDILENNAAKLAAHCEAYGKTIAANIINMEKNKSLIPYQKNMLVNADKGEGVGFVSLGRKSGQAYLKNLTLGRRVVSMAKSKDMLSGRIQGLFKLVK
eukprot:GFYU01001649.1.p1 GENE.GFYU01001649.1~~GFYU01001649.1.p1  ORF type:complete len:375 (-),score=130.38 GFYU01001649.1:97-1221(-)